MRSSEKTKSSTIKVSKRPQSMRNRIRHAAEILDRERNAAVWGICQNHESILIKQGRDIDELFTIKDRAGVALERKIFFGAVGADLKTLAQRVEAILVESEAANRLLSGRVETYQIEFEKTKTIVDNLVFRLEESDKKIAEFTRLLEIGNQRIAWLERQVRGQESSPMLNGVSRFSEIP